ncbi:MAG TPA: hypothetical protein VGO21_04275 [Candidatus Paceibacterota bacterium]|nr:hypothetical protein [Candidatus Paceibacterota bacterium]
MLNEGESAPMYLEFDPRDPGWPTIPAFLAVAWYLIEKWCKRCARKEEEGYPQFVGHTTKHDDDE